ncbi:MAG: hypothetical protein K8823_415 [Cenarchaeum symbiont of Oopsacas minuta]|nr:hypothetical protein [Cenarchaeum symbiont of Oopsacas minuta]
MKDLPDIIIQQGKTKCTSYPMRIIIRAELSKIRCQYFTYATKNATSRIISYLNNRLAKGESLHGDAPIVAPSQTDNR